MCVPVNACAMTCMWRSKDNFVGLLLAFPLHIGSGIGIQVIRLFFFFFNQMPLQWSHLNSRAFNAGRSEGPDLFWSVLSPKL